jgi:hypothetical protein
MSMSSGIQGRSMETHGRAAIGQQAFFHCRSAAAHDSHGKPVERALKAITIWSREK